VVNDVLYAVTLHQSLVALDPDTGWQIWVYRHKHEGRLPRGVAYWPGGKSAPSQLVFGTFDGFLLFVEAKTGTLVREIDLKASMKDEKKYPNSHYGLSGAPMVYKNVIITGSHTHDAPSLGPPGDAGLGCANGEASVDVPFRPATGRARTRYLAQRVRKGKLDRAFGRERMDNRFRGYENRDRLYEVRFAIDRLIWGRSPRE